MAGRTRSLEAINADDGQLWTRRKEGAAGGLWSRTGGEGAAAAHGFPFVQSRVTSLSLPLSPTH